MIDEVRPGQIWQDNDKRTAGSGEFVVTELVDVQGHKHKLSLGSQYVYAIVKRESGKTTRIRTDRLVRHQASKRGYTYLGMKK